MQPTDAPDTGPADVLAAEVFGVPDADPAFRARDLSLPPDLVGEEPHEVLAAEEFAMPAPEARHPVLSRRGRRRRLALRVGGGALPALALAVWRLRRRSGA